MSDFKHQRPLGRLLGEKVLSRGGNTKLHDFLCCQFKLFSLWKLNMDFFWGECIILSSVLLSKPLTFFFMITDDLSYTMKFTHFWEKIGSRKG
uniref:Uncharacterized protein n=1 Tax=Anguilla anguilla TaxID=7936 RepID=A0A0E9WZB9_ANGAN